jgi:SAM-dependent MidA family methyltransferase
LGYTDAYSALVSGTAEKLQFLLELQEDQRGCIRFDRWMREALYHEKFGYYTANIRDFGRRGDFTTWPAISKSLGLAVGRWILQNKSSDRANVIEIGAGNGDLAASVIQAIGWWKKPRYHIVEISSRLQEVQRERLGSKAVWHASVLEALEACGGAAVIISNEVVDAFPCRVFKKEGDGWRELALRIEGKVVVEEWIAAALPPSTVFFESWPVGQRVEVHESFRLWVREWLPVWKSGSILTIDYGDTCPTLYRRRPRGTLRAYAHHQRLEGCEVYGGFGLRDLTADVNFSDLQQEPVLLTRAFGTLTEFISAAGGFSAKNRASELLGAPGGAGEAFKFLVQTR